MISKHQRQVEAQEHARRAQQAARSAAAARRASSQSARTRRSAGSGRASRRQGSWTRQGASPALIYKHHRGGAAGAGYAELQTGAELLVTNMLHSTLARESEWAIEASMFPKMKASNLVQHISLSRPAGHALTSDQWRQVATKFLNQIGAEGVSHVAFRHTNTKHDHIHLIYSRALPSGKLLSLSQNFYKHRAALREVERQLGLQAVAVEQQAPAARTDRAVSARRRAERRGTTDGWIDPDIVRQAISQASSTQQLHALLAQKSIEFEVAKRPDGSARGLLYRRTGAAEWLSGSSIARDLTLSPVTQALEKNAAAQMRRQRQSIDQKTTTPEPQHHHERGG